MNRIKRVNVFFMILLLLQTFGSYAIGYFITNIIKLSPEQLRTPKVLLTILGGNQIILLFIPVLLYIIITKQSIRDVLKLNRINIKDLFFSFLIAVLFLPTMMLLSAVTQLFSKNDVSQLLSFISSGSILASVLVIAGFPAMFEEFTMRGVILSEYRNVSIKKAAIMNGILFSMLHMNIQQSLYTLAMGIVVSYLVYYTKSIFSSMIFHFTVNGINVLMAFFALKAAGGGTNSNLASQGDIPQGIMIIGMIIAFAFLLGIVIGTLALIILIMKNIKKRNTHKWQAPETIEGNTEFIYNANTFDVEEVVIKEEKNKKGILKNVVNIPFVLSIMIYIAGVFILK